MYFSNHVSPMAFFFGNASFNMILLHRLFLSEMFSDSDFWKYEYSKALICIHQQDHCVFILIHTNYFIITNICIYWSNNNNNINNNNNNNNNYYYYYYSVYRRKLIDGLSVIHVAEYFWYICLPGNIVASFAVRSHSCR